MTVFSYRGTERPINIQKRMKLTIHFWMVIIYFHNWMTLTIQNWMNVIVVKTIQNWMTLTIQNWMNLTVVNTFQNWMTLTIQNWMNVTVVNTIQNWMTLTIQNWMNLTVVNTFQNWMTLIQYIRFYSINCYNHTAKCKAIVYTWQCDYPQYSAKCQDKKGV